MLGRLQSRKSSLLAASLLVAACNGEPTAVTINTANVLADLAQVEAAFDDNAAFQSLAPSVLRLAPFNLTTGPVVPASERGKTYIWNSTALAFEVDPAATGAPANGVRLSLYRMDPINPYMPVMPLEPIGHADLLDVSSPSLDRLRILMTAGAATVGDYQLSGSRTINGISFNTLGFLRGADGSRRIDFTGSYVNNASGIDALAEVIVQGGPTISFDQQAAPTGNETVVMELASGGTTVTVTMTYTASSDHTAGTVKVNGAQAATFTWDSTNPVVTGGGLSSQQINELRQLIVRGFELGATSVQQVLTPAHHLF